MNMKEPNAKDQEIRWRFFLNLPSYDWAAETLKLVEKYKGRIDFTTDVDTVG
jgi:hypothetical protein